MTPIAQHAAQTLGVVALALATAAASAAQAASTGADDELAWLRARDEAAARADLASTLARLPADRRSDYLRRLGAALRSSPATVLPGGARRRLVEAHYDLLRAHGTAEPSLVEWFATRAADFCAAGFDHEGALAVLADIAAMVATSTQFEPQRRLQELDYRVACQQLGAADALCERMLAAATTPAARADVMARRGSIDVMLGRLDVATLRLDAAAGLLAECEAAGETTAGRRFLLLCRRLDLLTAREQFDAVRPQIQRFERERSAAGKPLDDEQRRQLELHALAADYRATQEDPERIAATVAGLEAALAGPSLSAAARALASLWLADLELRRGRLARAEELLALADRTPTRAHRWLSAAIRSELARATNADAEQLARHEADLRAILREMIAEWRQLSWERESTGFLRLGARLRMLAELVAVTAQRHGPEAALQDVLDVQCCTGLSRARGAAALPFTELRQRVLRDGHGALVFVPAWNGSHLFAFDKTRCVHAILPRAAELRRRTATLREELLALDHDAPPAPTVAALGQRGAELATALLPPAVRQLMANWTHLTITGGNLLGAPAFGCLPWDDGTLLGERFALATIGSLPLLARLQESAPPPADDLPCRVVATLSPAADFAARNDIQERLLLAGDRWQRLLAALPPDTNLHVDGDATVAAYLAADAARADRLAVLLAHGEPPAVDRAPALGLAPDARHPDGALTPPRIAAVQLRGLVVLAACHAARGPLRMGDDDVAESLAGAFLGAGADAVVASPAPLRLGMHLAASAAVVQSVRAGIDAAEALRLARVQLAAGGQVERYRAAQLEVTGLGALALAPPRPAGGIPWGLAAGVAAVAVLLGVSCLRRRPR